MYRSILCCAIVLAVFTAHTNSALCRCTFLYYESVCSFPPPASGCTAVDESADDLICKTSGTTSSRYNNGCTVLSYWGNSTSCNGGPTHTIPLGSCWKETRPGKSGYLLGTCRTAIDTQPIPVLGCVQGEAPTAEATGEVTDEATEVTDEASSPASPPAALGFGLVGTINDSDTDSDDDDSPLWTIPFFAGLMALFLAVMALILFLRQRRARPMVIEKNIYTGAPAPFPPQMAMPPSPTMMSPSYASAYVYDMDDYL
eukprot:TRINITY_DN66969_c12_g5_i1.p1 TRINITY_DN66969_c12_g5~~TRINITY_DN66969_c12_g5_i1.p1  ORF type:complete len:257 (-),score=27.97 TRINITY_DN66969_c12_g5_i1:608-1378(-)